MYTYVYMYIFISIYIRIDKQPRKALANSVFKFWLKKHLVQSANKIEQVYRSSKLTSIQHEKRHGEGSILMTELILNTKLIN